VQGQTPTPEFTDFVNTYLTKWTGFVAETVFDVNCLVLDESHVIISVHTTKKCLTIAANTELNLSLVNCVTVTSGMAVSVVAHKTSDVAAD
jgi:hypothetical protein